MSEEAGKVGDGAEPITIRVRDQVCPGFLDHTIESGVIIFDNPVKKGRKYKGTSTFSS